MKKFVKNFGLSLFFLGINALVFFVLVLSMSAFWTSLIILFSSLTAQIMLCADNADLTWDRFGPHMFYKNDYARNFWFNLTKLITFIQILYIGFSFSENQNQFGVIGLAISICLTLVLSLFYYLISDKGYGYSTFRGLVMIPVLVAILVSMYLFFGTQFIWLPVVLCFLICFLNAFNEVKNLFTEDYNEYDHLLLGILFIVAIVSTVIQFANVELFWGILVWYVPVGLVALITAIGIIYFARQYLSEYVSSLKKSILEKREKLAKEAELKKIELKRIEEEREIDNQIDKMFMYGCGKYPSIQWSLEDVLFIIKNKKYVQMNDQHTRHLLAWGLGSVVSLKNFIIISVSDIKNQVIFHNKSTEILRLYNEAHRGAYDDRAIEDLENEMDRFRDYLNQKKIANYKGIEELKRIVNHECVAFPKYVPGERKMKMFDVKP
ncbi:MAG: hypothetical protein ACOYL8_04010 [Patescibacteria group bacterium]